jgi:ABC-type ATPase involved in cell division
VVRQVRPVAKSGSGSEPSQRRASATRLRALPRPMLVLSGVRKSFGRRLVLDDLAFSGSLGDLVVITGDSGAGKTTLLRLIHGETRPDRGQLWVGGHPLHRRFLRGDESVRRDAGFIFQEHRLLPRLTALENVVYGVQVSRPDVPYGVIRRAAQEALEALDLGAAKGHFPDQLSAGERQRVAVARAVAGQPRLVLADEPTAAQDERTAGLVMRLLAAAADGGALVVLATHHFDLRCSVLVNLPKLGAVERRPGRLAAAVRRRTRVTRRAPA